VIVNQWFIEDIKTMRNLTEIILFLADHRQDHLLATMIEILGEHTQKAIFDYCVVNIEGV
jgi:hypothetical protein